MISLYDFFEIDTRGVPMENAINKLAFSSEDVKYKAKFIKEMQDLGMIVTIDKIGNICGTIPGKLFTNKSIICGSHTDSVDNGGQFDGPLGVFAALKTAENIISQGKTNLVNYKAIIYTSEESTRFNGKCCLGSKYLRGDILDFDKIKSRDNITLAELVKNYKNELSDELDKLGCTPLKEVEKVIESNEIITALEGHIEQSDELRNHNNNIGICTSIVAPYRVKVDISDIETAADFICKLTENAKHPENLSKYRITVPEFSIKNKYLDSDLEGKKLISIRSIGESNHSGATPMNERKDAVYGAAKLVQFLKNIEGIKFLETCTANWGSNQINNCCEIKLAIDENSINKDLLKLFLAEKDIWKLSGVEFKFIDDIINKDKSDGLFIDVRQQVGMNTKLSNEMIFDTLKDIVHITGHNCYMNITAKGEPFKTSSDLVQSATQICEEKQINYEILQSWAGHDLATLTNNPNARTLLIFCDNSGGSHNLHETTTVDAITKLIDVESSLAEKELSRANNLYLNALYSSLKTKKFTLENCSNIPINKKQLHFVNKKLNELISLSRELDINLSNSSEQIETDLEI